MNKTTLLRILSFLLLSAMLISAFAACDSSEKKPDETNAPANSDSNATEGTEEVVTEATPEDIEHKNYDAEFYLRNQTDCNPMKMFWVEKSEGDTLSEAVFARQEKIKNWIGVDVIAEKASGHTTYASDFINSVTTKDGSVDVLLTHISSGITPMVSGGYFRSFNEVDGIDLDKDYWNHDFMDKLAINDKYYLGFGDFNLLRTYVVILNKDLLSQKALEGYSQKEVYDSVRNGTWTLDKFIDLATKGYTQKGGPDKDVYGLVSQQWVPWIGFFHSSGINLVDMDEDGTYKVAVMNEKNKEKTTALVTKLKDISASGMGEFTFPAGGSISHPGARMQNKRALMELDATTSLESLLSYEITFGVLPYPLYDTNQYDPDSASLGYRSLQWGGSLGIANYLAKDSAIIGETLELLNFYAPNVQTAYFEKLLGKQISQAPDDAEMLNIIWKSVCSDMGQTFNDEIGYLYFLPKVTWPGSDGMELVSYNKSLESSANKAIKKFIRKVGLIGSK